MKISDKFMVSSVGGEDVILPIDNECVDYNSVFVLGGTGMFIVSLMPASRDDIISSVLAEYEVDRDTATRALGSFLGELKTHGILED